MLLTTRTRTDGDATTLTAKWKLEWKWGMMLWGVCQNAPRWQFNSRSFWSLGICV